MSKNIKVELNLKGLNELMKSPEMEAHLNEVAHEVAQIAGNDFGERVHQASYVAIANVYPESRNAAKKNYKENVLIKALSSAGLRMKK